MTDSEREDRFRSLVENLPNFRKRELWEIFKDMRSEIELLRFESGRVG